MQQTSEATSPSKPVLQPYDLELIRALAGDFLLLTRQQICQLFPDRSVRNTNYRIRKLVQAGFISSRLFPTSFPLPKLPLYYLGPRAGEALGFPPNDPKMLARRKQAPQLRDGAIPHFLSVNAVHIKFIVAPRNYPEYELLAWIDQYDPLWRTLNQYGFALRPDAYAEYRTEGHTVRFFLELDRGTERGRAIHRKLAAYYDYAASGRFEHHFAASTFRVLFITTTSRRLRQILRHVPANTTPELFWVSTTPSFLSQPLFHPHWSLAGSDIFHSLATPL